MHGYIRQISGDKQGGLASSLKLWSMCSPSQKTSRSIAHRFDMLWFNFMLGLNFILFCFIHIIIHYQAQKQKKIKFKQRIELNHNRYIKILTGLRGFNCKYFKIPLSEETWTQRNPNQIRKNDPTASESC